MRRDEMLERLRDRDSPWDIVIIGGGATGIGAAVDAASRGYDVLLLEQSDFAKGTSSRSTKLVHGGVRYLQQGNVSLVMEALKERGLLRQNAPHLVRDLAFVVPSYAWWESPFYGIGLKVYDLLAGRYGFGSSKHLSREDVIQRIPTIETDGLRGGTLYYDGQFDDARLALNLVQTAAEQGATVLNYIEVVGLQKDGDGRVAGVIARETEVGEEFQIEARAVINATGPFADQVRRLDDARAEPMLAPSQGVHVVLDRRYLPGGDAIMVPRTDDGRVMFAIPWYDSVVVGTTDTPITEVALEPTPLAEEVDFILETADRYLEADVTPAAVRSVFTGIRPLVRAAGGASTATLSRDHTIFIDPVSGLLTIVGGKWTTYRKMAEDVVDHAATLAGLAPSRCVTRDLGIHGFHLHAEKFGELARYGSDAPALRDWIASHPDHERRIHPRLSLRAGEVLWACRNEMARTVDDVLARRSRSLLFDARAATEAASDVARLMAPELGRDTAWVAAQVRDFGQIAARHLLPG